jgi:predicted RND superfamily exporter protein
MARPAPPRAADRVAAWLIAWRLPLFLLALVGVAVAVERSGQLRFSRSIDKMFDRTDPALVPYRRLARTFGSSEIVLAAYEDPELFSPAGIARLEQLTTRLAAMPGLDSATSLASTPLGRRIIDLDGGLSAGWARRLVSLMEGYAVGPDHRTAAVVCVLRPPGPAAQTAREQAVSRAETIDSLREVMREFPSGTVAGEPAMLRDGFAMLERDGNLLGTASGVLAGLVLLVSFRSLRWLFVPLAVVLWALWATRGTLAVLGLELTMVSTMLSAMIVVVGIATVTHVIVEFRRQRSLGLEPAAALRAALAVLFWPVVGAIATDVIGFGSLIASRVGPVHDFGVMTSIGAVMVLVAAGLVLPFLALAGRFDADPRMAWGESVLGSGLDGLVARIVRRPVPILCGSLAFVAVATAGMRWLAVETDFTRNFRPDSPTVAAYDMVETRLGGAGVWDVLVPAPFPIDGNTLAAAARLCGRLRDEVTLPDQTGRRVPALTKVMGVTDALAAAPLLPLQPGPMMAGAINLMLQQDPADRPSLGSGLVGRDPADGSVWLRISLRARERQPAAAKRELVAQVRRIVAEEFPAAAGRPGGEVTGFFVLLSQLVDRMLADQWLTFVLAAVGIFLLLASAFRSPLVAAIALVPNALPIFVVLGLMGWCGARINMGTAMIAAVSMGLSVDSSIHYITAFRRRLAADGACTAALETAHQTAGRAMIFSTLALVVGFLALTTSGFMPTVSFGWLSCLTLVGGLLGNLVVLPVLLVLATGRDAAGCPPPENPLQHPASH